MAPLNRFKPSSKIFYWPFQGGTSFVDILCFCSVLCLLCFVRVCLYVLRGHLLGKGWPLGSRLWCLLWVCHFPIGILGQAGVVLDCIDSWSLQPYLLWATKASGNFVDFIFHEVYNLTSFLKPVSLLATGALGCYSELIAVFFFLKKICN